MNTHNSDNPKIELVAMQNFHGHVPQGYISIQTETYYAWWDHQQPDLLRVRCANGESPEWAEIRLLGSLNHDETSARSPAWIDLKPEDSLCDETEVTLHARIGENEQITLSFTHEHISLQYIHERPPSPVIHCTLAGGRELGSIVHAKSIFDSRPASHGIFEHPLHHHLDAKNLWFSPAPFCYPLRMLDDSWASVSVEPTLEELKFCRFVAEPAGNSQLRFALKYDSNPAWTGAYRSPALVWRFGAKDPYEAIATYARAHAERAEITPERPAPEPWWQGLMLCGWPNQGAVAKERGGTPQQWATQNVYEEHLAVAEAAGIDPDIVTIDDNWAVSHGQWEVDVRKWPDLPGFIRTQHGKGRRVLLWVSAATGGLPEDELYRVGDPPYEEWLTRHLDPFNPQWLDRLERSLRVLLGDGPDGCGADGLKLDFTGNIPVAGVHHAARELHGLEYTWWVFKRIHDAAKAVRPDCLLDFQVANPLFAPLHDMTRLNDCFLPARQALRTMKERAAVARAAAFDPMIDTDGPISPDYFRAAPGFGNPSLYLENRHFCDAEIVQAILDAHRSMGARTAEPVTL